MQTKSLNLIPVKREEVLAMVEAMSPAEKALVGRLAGAASRLDSGRSVDARVLDVAAGNGHGGRNLWLQRASGSGRRGGDCLRRSARSPGEGYATEAAEALVIFAFSSDQVRVVRAHTLPEANASTRVLTKCGFRFIGEVIDPEDGLVWRWEESEGRSDENGTNENVGCSRFIRRRWRARSLGRGVRGARLGPRASGGSIRRG